MEYLNEERLFEFLIFAGKSFHSCAPEYCNMCKLCLNFSVFVLGILKFSSIFDSQNTGM